MPPQQPPSYPLNSPPHPDGDVKAPYDDLIDQYATSYNAYTVDPSAFDLSKHIHGHSPSYSLSHKQPRRSDESSKDIKVHEDGSIPRLDWEYPPQTPKKEVQKASLWETIIPDSIACRLYVLTVVIETAIDLAIEAELLVRVRQMGNNTSSGDASYRKMTVYLSIFALAHVFQLIMALDAVYARNTLQFVCLTIFNAVFLVYAVIQIGEIQDSLPPNTVGFSKVPVDVLTTVIPCVIAVAELAYMALGWKIYTEFGWKVYKFLGADRRIKSMFAHYQIFLCLVKFDVFFWVGFSVQFIWLVLNGNGAEYYLTCAALPLSVVVLVIGHLAARRENRPTMMIFMTGCIAALVYFMYKLVKVLKYKDTPTFILVWKTLTTFSVIAIILLLITFVFACVVMNNFGRGLKTRVVGKHLQGGKSQDLHRGPMSTHPNRMSIE